MIRRFLCLLGRHRLYRKQKVGYASWLVGCAHCRREWGMNDEVRSFVPWDGELESFHAELLHDQGLRLRHDGAFPGVQPKTQAGAP